MLRQLRSQIQPIGLDLGLDSIKMLQLEVREGAMTANGDVGAPSVAVVAAAKLPHTAVGHQPRDSSIAPSRARPSRIAAS